MQDTAHQRSPRRQYLGNENALQEERNGVMARLNQQVKSIVESISASSLCRPERSTCLYLQSTKLKACVNYIPPISTQSLLYSLPMVLLKT